jgi:hypothetical protein
MDKDERATVDKKRRRSQLLQIKGVSISAVSRVLDEVRRDRTVLDRGFSLASLITHMQVTWCSFGDTQDSPLHLFVLLACALSDLLCSRSSQDARKAFKANLSGDAGHGKFYEPAIFFYTNIYNRLNVHKAMLCCRSCRAKRASRPSLGIAWIREKRCHGWRVRRCSSHVSWRMPSMALQQMAF